MTISGGGSEPRLSGRQWCDRLDLRPDHLRRLGLGGNGGGLANYGTATLTDCTISGNYAASYNGSVGGLGGGVFNAGTANLTLTDCTVSGNSSSSGGGGVWNAGTATT